MTRLLTIALLGVVTALVMTPGCATVPDPEPPDLTPAERAVDIRIQSIEASQESMADDIKGLQQMGQEVSVVLDDLRSADLPHSLLRLVAMNCLNTEYQGLTSPVVGLEGTPLTCRPTHSSYLIEQLEHRPTAARDQALQLLYLIDQTRILRGSLRLRLANLPATISDHRDFIADQRAMVRQLESDLRRRRGRYSTRGWRETMAPLDDHRQRLQELDEQVEKFSEIYPAWPAEIDDVMATLYFELVELRAARPTPNSPPTPIVSPTDDAH